MRTRHILGGRRSWLAAFAACLFAPNFSFGQDEPAVDLFEPLGSASFQPLAAGAARSSYPIKVRFDALGSLGPGQGVRLRFSTTAAGHWEGVIRRIERRNEESFSLFGDMGAVHDGWFIFTVEGGTVVGTIQKPTDNLHADLRKAHDDVYSLRCFDARQTQQFKCGLAGAIARPGVVADSLHGPPIQYLEGDPLPQQDIMVLYTMGLLNDFTNHFPNTPVDTAIQHFVDFANQCYVNSSVQLRLRLAYRGLADANFSEAGRARGWLLDNLIGTNDGYLDHVHQWRTTYHADLVCLMYSLDTQQAGGGGLASLLDPINFAIGNPANWYDDAFCVVEGLWEPSSVEPPVSGMVPTEFAHEIGHVQGLNHNCEDDGGLAPVTSFAYAWRFTGNSGSNHLTIMAYATGPFSSATPIPHFSNPAVLFDGQPTGNATTAGCRGTTGARDAEALNLTADFMSRLHLNPLDPWVDFNHFGLVKNGRFETPWSSLLSAINDLPWTTPAGTPEPPTITFKGPASSGPLSITINKRLKLDAHGGPVKLGGS